MEEQQASKVEFALKTSQVKKVLTVKMVMEKLQETLSPQSFDQDPSSSKCFLEIEGSHVTSSPNPQSKDSCDAPISPNENNKMEFIWRTQRGKGKERKSSHFQLLTSTRRKLNM